MAGRHLNGRRSLLWCGLVLLLGLIAAPGPAVAEPLLSSNSTVVLLAGLAGDTESETAYNDQLQTWLRLLAEPSPAPRVVVFYDRGDAISVPAGLQAEIQPANRTNFLTLVRTLQGTQSPVLVIAWGHGGKQGPTPVLHVRGPRLAPPDFLAVASVLPVSKWILFFRGSGEFARALAGNRRQILASESQTMFTSDPVGMSLVLKTLRDNPTISLDGLARRTGSAVASWYSERNLARTEEPTLWVEGQKPLLLADSGQATTPSASVAGKQPDEDTDSSGSRTNKAAGPVSAPGKFTETVPSGRWKQIQAVEAKEYPEDDGVILQQKVSCTLGSSPAVSIDQEQFIQILTLEGKRFGDFDVSFSPPAEDIEFLDCEVLRPDGKLIRADPDSARDAQEDPGGEYEGRQRRFFSLPGVAPGSILHVHYRKQWKQFPLPEISLALPLSEELPVVTSSVQVTVPKQSPFHFAFEGLSAPDPAVQQSGYSTSYAWEFKNALAPPREVLSPPHQGQRLLLSTFKDWSAFAQWYARITRLTSEASPEIVAKAKELTQLATNDTQRLNAIYNYVTGLRYVAVPLGVNTVRPHAASNVFRNQYGDCKDKANLLNALLSAVNIDARLVLVPRFEQAFEAVPGLSFNHAISRVSLGSSMVWVDTTDDICRFGLLPPGDPGRKVLVIDGQTDTLTELPLSAPEDNRLSLQADINLSTSSEGWPTTIKVLARGYPDYQLREATRENREGRGGLPLLAAHWRPISGSFALNTQTMTLASQLEQDFSWQGEGALVGVSQTRLIHAPFWVPREWDLALHRRRSPLFMNRGYPLALDEEFRLKLPSSAQGIVLPGSCRNVKGPLLWSLEWTRMADDAVAARFHAELAKGELSLAETSAFQQELRALLTAMASDTSPSQQ